MALTGTDTRMEYDAIASGCAVFDRSERGKLALSGSGAKSFMQGQVSNDVEALQAGEGCYAAFLTPKGKMLGDLRILDTGDELLLDTERVSLQALFNLIRHFSVGYDVELHKRTRERGLLSLLGPEAHTISGVSQLPDSEHAHLATEVLGEPVRAIRTQMGVDLLCDQERLGRLMSSLRNTGAVEVSEAVVECRRVERGWPRYGVDLDETVIPQEAGLNEAAVSFTKGCYVGQETVARLYYRGKPNRLLRGLTLSANAASGDQLMLGERPVGRIGTCVDSPTFGPIALALVRREAPPGSTVSVGSADVSGQVVELPFRARPTTAR